MAVPAGCGENFAVGAVGETLLAGMLCWSNFDGFRLGIPDGFARGEGVLGYICVGGGSDVGVFTGGDGE